ncbi:MAG: PAS domain-containing protein [Nitrospira sp.]|nr:PAS domain-containing protein [Nitrospira sp.]
MGIAPKISPVNAARDFLINELFFSTTTNKGIIVSGNDVFARVSKYQIEEMIGKPHNLIRHPDMPRTVFKLLWDYLLAGKSIAAYVKNMAVDGRYYWVVALVAPIEGGGYVSIRFKPSSQLFGIISDIYGELRAIEQTHEENGDGPKAGMHSAEAKFGEILRAKGFADYDAFMQTLLYQELNSRDDILAREHLSIFPPLPKPHAEEGALSAALRRLYQDSQQTYQQVTAVYTQLKEYMSRNDELGEHSRGILALTGEFQLICLNLTVASSRLANAGHTLTVVSAHLHEASASVATIVSGLATQASKISTCLGETVFGWAWARLQSEVIIIDYHECLTKLVSHDNQTNPTVYLKRLGDLRSAFSRTIERVEHSLHDLGKKLKGLTIEVEELRKALLSLQVTYVGGLVEASRLSEVGNFSTIFHDVHKHIAETKVKLAKFAQIISRLDSLARLTPHITDIASCARDQLRIDQERLSVIANQTTAKPGPSLSEQRKQPSQTQLVAG